MLRQVYGNPWVQTIGLLLSIALLCGLIFLMSPVLIPLFAAFMVAYLLDPVVDYFENVDGQLRKSTWRLSRGATTTMLALAGMLLLLSVPFVVVPQVISQAKDLIAAPSVSVNEARERKSEEGEDEQDKWHETILEALPLDEFIRTMGWEQEGLDAREIIATRIGEYVQANAVQLVKNFGGQFAEAGMNLAQFAKASGRTLINIIVLLGNFALFAFVAGYLLKDFDNLLASVVDLIPPRYRRKTVEIFSKIDQQLRGFIRGQLTVCLCLGSMYAIGLSICSVPFALLIAVFGMFASLIPYLGIVLTVLPALLMVFLRHGLDWHIVGVIITFGIAQALEGNVLTPKIVGDKVGLHPVWVILAILVFSSALGFLGLIIAVPLAASLKVLIVEAVTCYKSSQLFVSTALPSRGSVGDPPTVVKSKSAPRKRAARKKRT